MYPIAMLHLCNWLHREWNWSTLIIHSRLLQSLVIVQCIISKCNNSYILYWGDWSNASRLWDTHILIYTDCYQSIGCVHCIPQFNKFALYGVGCAYAGNCMRMWPWITLHYSHTFYRPWSPDFGLTAFIYCAKPSYLSLWRCICY